MIRKITLNNEQLIELKMIAAYINEIVDASEYVDNSIHMLSDTIDTTNMPENITIDINSFNDVDIEPIKVTINKTIINTMNGQWSIRTIQKGRFELRLSVKELALLQLFITAYAGNKKSESANFEIKQTQVNGIRLFEIVKGKYFIKDLTVQDLVDIVNYKDK